MKREAGGGKEKAGYYLLLPVPCSLFPVPCSLFPIPYPLSPLQRIVIDHLGRIGELDAFGFKATLEF